MLTVIEMAVLEALLQSLLQIPFELQDSENSIRACLLLAKSRIQRGLHAAALEGYR
jgi:hypothetical protein